MKKKQSGWIALLALACLTLNWGGDRLAARLNWPIWLDSVGTVVCAFLLGPLCGVLVGVTYNLLDWMLYGNPWYYALISVLIGLIAGLAGRRKKLDTLLDTLTTCALLAGVVSLAAYPLNLLLNGASTGNPWGQAVMGFLGERGFPPWAGLMIGEMYVELLDKLAILLVLFALRRGVRGLRKLFRLFREKRKRWKNRENRWKGASRSAALGLALMIFAGTHAVLSRARGEEDNSPPRFSYNDYVQTVYSTTNGLPCGEANAIAMTGDGILWIGTYAGLYRYNGREFRWMDGYDSVRNVNCLYVDEEGRLWIGTNDNGLTILINEQAANVIDHGQGLPSNSVKSIIKSSDGYYYIGTTGSMQVLTLNTGLRRVVTLPEIVYADHSAADQEGRVAAVNNDGTIFLLKQGQILCSRRLPGEGAVFKSCAFAENGELWAATTGNEIYRFSLQGNQFTQLDVRECPGLQNIKTLHFLEEGQVFICADNGIAFLDGDGNYQRINTNDFNNSIDNMLVDYQGNLWFTSSRLGLLRLAPSDFRDIYSTVGMDRRVVNTIVRWRGAVYIGTDKGLDAVDLQGRTRIQNQLTDRFDRIRIRCMMVDQEDHLWVCTYGSGLVEIAPDGKEYLYNHESGAFGNRARTICQLRDGTILAAGDTGLSFLRDHRVQHTIGRSDGLITSMVLTMVEMTDGRILVGTDGDGIAILREGQVEKLLTRADGLSSEVILRMIPDGEAGVFIVTSNGLCYLDGQGRIRTLDNFPYYNNYDIWISGDGRLFVLSSAGLYIVDREELLSGRTDLKTDLLDARRGLTGSLTANAWTWFQEDSGELYLPCDTGVYVMSTGSLSAGAALYRMNMTSIRLDGETRQVERNAVIRIPREVSRIEILPEVINYTIQDPYVGYMLEGFDAGWTIVAQNTLSTIPYTNLPTGDFTFHLAVFDNAREHILAERTWQMTKEKEMYDHPWFILYLLSVPMFTVCWVTWLLVKRHERKMEAELAAANRQVEMGKQTVVAIARTVDAKDERTSEHSRRVAQYSRMIAEAYGLPKKECQDIEWSAQMHDIGKIAIPDAILNKDSRLTDEEYGTMKTHTTRGADILKDFTLLDNVIEGAEYHHERYDGRGYPKGLKGEEIPLFARIIGVADAFDAMTANRVYRKQMDFGYVLGELEKGRGTQFDPQFVDILLQLIREGRINLKEIYHIEPEQAPEGEKPAEKKEQTPAAPKAEKPEQTPGTKENQQEPAKSGPEKGAGE